MLEIIGEGLKASSSIVSLVEKVASRILSIRDKQKKRAELHRLIELLNETRISRTMNAGLAWYIRKTIEDYKNGSDGREIEVAAEQIEKSIFSIFEIIERMSDKRDRIAIYENAAWNELHKVVSGRKRLLDELKKLEINKRNLNKLSVIAEDYERLTDKLMSVSCELSRYGRELDSGTKSIGGRKQKREAS